MLKFWELILLSKIETKELLCVIHSTYMQTFIEIKIF